MPQSPIASLVGILLAASTLMGCHDAQQVQHAQENQDEAVAVFATWKGAGPDKWASVWLVARHINPDSQVRLLDVGTPIPEDVVAFDVPEARFLRDARSTTFDQIRAEYRPDDPDLATLGDIVRSIEVFFWGNQEDVRSRYVETAYRALQRARPHMPHGCMLSFFDNVAAGLDSMASGTAPVDEALATGALLPPDACETQNQFGEVVAVVPELSVASVAELLRKGKQVTFVDVRETAEFRENHIPGAINLKIRELADDGQSRLPASDLYVAYCVKDFRGFEMARRLRTLGYNAAVIQPYGIKGWVASGLPVYNTGNTEDSAMTELELCLEDLDGCLNKPTGST